jgi:curved DNA-binding protein CbpA
MAFSGDPYKVLGVAPEATEEQIRAAYHRLVQAHHPDHNQGSAESARRFEEIQEAYSRIRSLRSARPRVDQAPPPPAAAADPQLEARLAGLEGQVRRAQAERERARRKAAAEARGAMGDSPRASEEELGYVKTDDSFGKILADAEAELTKRLGGARDNPAGRRVGELIDELTERLKRERGS